MMESPDSWMFPKYLSRVEIIVLEYATYCHIPGENFGGVFYQAVVTVYALPGHAD